MPTKSELLERNVMMAKALKAALKLIEVERQSLIDGYTILYTGDPDVGKLSPDGKEAVRPFNRVRRLIQVALEHL